MECYITYCIKGFLAFSEDFELITQKLFPKESIVTALMEIENKKIVPQEKEIIEEVSKDYDKIIRKMEKKEFTNYERKQYIINSLVNPSYDYQTINEYLKNIE